MADNATPTKPAPIQGYRSRAINAVADFANALRPVAGNGINITDGAGGKTISLDARGNATSPKPWGMRVYPMTGDTDPALVKWMLAVWPGAVVDFTSCAALTLGAGSAPTGCTLATYDPTDGVVDASTGLTRYEVAAPASAKWLVAARTSTGYCLAWSDSPALGESGVLVSAPVAYVDPGDGTLAPEVTQICHGVLYIGGGKGADGADGTDGQDGADGADGVGVYRIEAGTPTVGATTTTTPVTVTLTDGTTQTFDVVAQNGESGGSAEHWGTRTDTNLNGAPAIDAIESLQIFQFNGGQGRIVNVSRNSLDNSTQSLTPGGVAFRYLTQQVVFVIDGRGNVRQCNTGATQSSPVAITYPPKSAYCDGQTTTIYVYSGEINYSYTYVSIEGIRVPTSVTITVDVLAMTFSGGLLVSTAKSTPTVMTFNFTN